MEFVLIIEWYSSYYFHQLVLPPYMIDVEEVSIEMSGDCKCEWCNIAAPHRVRAYRYSIAFDTFQSDYFRFDLHETFTWQRPHTDVFAYTRHVTRARFLVITLPLTVRTRLGKKARNVNTRTRSIRFPHTILTNNLIVHMFDICKPTHKLV